MSRIIDRRIRTYTFTFARVRHFGYSILDTGSFPASVLGIHHAVGNLTTGISSSSGG